MRQENPTSTTIWGEFTRTGDFTVDASGDIILDAVLTDTGRKRLAKGDGSFRIVKLSLIHI